MLCVHPSSTEMRRERRKCTSCALKVSSPCGFSPGRGLEFGDRLLFYLVQPNRRFQHQKHIKALFADVLHYLGDLLGLGNRLMNGFPQLLDKTTKSLVQ